MKGDFSVSLLELDMQSCDLPRIVRTWNVVTKKDNVENIPD